MREQHLVLRTKDAIVFLIKIQGNALKIDQRPAQRGGPSMSKPACLPNDIVEENASCDAFVVENDEQEDNAEDFFLSWPSYPLPSLQEKRPPWELSVERRATALKRPWQEKRKRRR